jgi:hypothetical protein
MEINLAVEYLELFELLGCWLGSNSRDSLVEMELKFW